jgi:hypothetical protein
MKLERRLAAVENALNEAQAEIEGPGGIYVVDDCGRVVQTLSRGGTVAIFLPQKADPREFALPSERQ